VLYFTGTLCPMSEFDKLLDFNQPLDVALLDQVGPCSDKVHGSHSKKESQLLANSSSCSLPSSPQQQRFRVRGCELQGMLVTDFRVCAGRDGDVLVQRR